MFHLCHIQTGVHLEYSKMYVMYEMSNDRVEDAVSPLPYSFLSHEVSSCFLLGEVIQATKLQHLWTSLNLSW